MLVIEAVKLMRCSACKRRPTSVYLSAGKEREKRWRAGIDFRVKRDHDRAVLVET